VGFEGQEYPREEMRELEIDLRERNGDQGTNADPKNQIEIHVHEANIMSTRLTLCPEANLTKPHQTCKTPP